MKNKVWIYYVKLYFWGIIYKILLSIGNLYIMTSLTIILVTFYFWQESDINLLLFSSEYWIQININYLNHSF